MQLGSTRSSVVLRNVVDALSSLGLDRNALLAHAKLDQRQLDALPDRVPISLHNRVWDAALAISKDPCIGVYVAAKLNTETYDIVGGVVHHSATLGDAIVRLARYGRLLGVGFDMRLVVDGERALLEEPHYGSPALHLQGVICQLVNIGITGCRLTGMHLHAIELRVTAARPADASPIEQRLETPLRFGALHNAVVFPSELLHLPVLTHDRERVTDLERQAATMLKASVTSFAHTVRAQLAVGTHEADVATIAARLHMTTRTLARRLEAEGTSFRELREEVRRRHAEDYLRSTTTSATEIAISLGFSDVTAFARAFKRWTGVSPTQFRTSTRLVP
jgi:AraC-like DNA-binding protein